MEGEKSIHEKLNLIIANQEKQEDKYLPKEPYKKMLGWYRYTWEHPKQGLMLIFLIAEGALELCRKGIISLVLSYFLK